MYRPIAIMPPSFSFETKGKQRSEGACLSPTKFHSIRSLHTMREFVREKLNANCGLWNPLPLNDTANSVLTLLLKWVPNQKQNRPRPDQLQRNSRLFALSETFAQWCSSRCHCVSFERDNHGYNSVSIGRAEIWFYEGKLFLNSKFFPSENMKFA